MPVRNQTEYLKSWRARHANYHRDWMRKHRGWRHYRNRVYILGVLCSPRWMPIPSVTKDEAEKEFLALTEGMK